MTRERVGNGREATGDPRPESEVAPGKRSRTQRHAPSAAATSETTLADPLPPWDGPALEAGDDPFALHLDSPVQQRGGAAPTAEETHAHAARGIAGPESELPHRSALERSFGPEHDLSRVRAHVGGDAEASAHAMGAQAFATGDHVALPENPSVGLVAHEVAHTIQQRAGVHLSGNVGTAGDPHEQEADAIAEGVERGDRIGHLLPISNAASAGVVQRREDGGPAVPGGGKSHDQLIRFLTGLRPELLIVTPRPLIVSQTAGTTAQLSVHAPFVLPATAPPTTVVARLLDGRGKEVWQSAGGWGKGAAVAQSIPLTLPGKGTYGLRVRVQAADVATRDLETTVTAQTDEAEGLPGQSDIEVAQQRKDLQARLATEADPKQRGRLEKAYKRTEWEASQRGLEIAPDSNARKGGLPTDPVAMRAFLEHEIARKGWSNRRAYLYGVSYNSEEGGKQLDIANEQFAHIEAEMSAFRESFKGSTYNTAYSMLGESTRTMAAIAGSYGAATPAGLELAAQKIRNEPDALEVQVEELVRGAKTRDDVTPGARARHSENRDDLRSIIPVLVERQRDVERVLAQQEAALARSHQHQPHHAKREGARIDLDDGERSKALQQIEQVRKGRGEGPLLQVTPVREHLSIDEISARLHAAQKALESTWVQAEASHPLLIAYRGGMGESKTLAKLGGGDDAMQRDVLRTILPRYADAGKAMAMLEAGKPHPLSLGPVVAMTKQRLQVAPGSMRAAVVDDLVDEHDGSAEQWIIMAVALALAAISFLPSGGASSALVLGAEVGGLALDAYLAVKASVEYDQAKVLGNTDLTVAHSLAGEEPSLTWLALSLVSMGVSGAVVRSVWKDAVALRRSAEAGRASQEAIQQLNQLGKEHKLGDIGTRVADEPAGVSEATGLSRASVSSTARQHAQHLGGLAADNLDGLATRLGTGVEVDKGLRHGQIDIDFDPAGGHVWVIGLRVSPDATVDDVLAHAKALEQMRRYNGRLGDLRRALDRAKGVGKAARTPGTPEWRAVSELEKLAEEIRIRQAALRKAPPDAVASRLDAEIAVLDAKMAEYQTVLSTGSRDVRVSESVVSSPALERKNEPVKGLYEGIDTKKVPDGWIINDRVHPPEADGTKVIETEVISPSGETGFFVRAYNPSTEKLEMRVAFLEQLPKWIKTPGTPLTTKGIPTNAYITMRQMKILGVGYGAADKVKMSTIQNVKTIVQLHAAKLAGINPDVAIMTTHSVEYASTSIVQSGHKIVSAHVGGTPTKGKLQDLLSHYEARDPDLVHEYDKIIKAYGQGKVTRETVLEYDFDIELEVSPYKVEEAQKAKKAEGADGAEKVEP